jgi:hypothetical protein
MLQPGGHWLPRAQVQLRELLQQHVAAALCRCNCVNCCNNKESEQVRQAAVEAILERNPNAFRPKIQARA